jgi:hypothetical protein
MDTCPRKRASQVSHGGVAPSFATPSRSDLILLHEAETKQDVEVYMSAMKLLVNVFSMSHQTHYVDLNTDFAKTWFCAWDAERKMYEKLFLFR